MIDQCTKEIVKMSLVLTQKLKFKWIQEFQILPYEHKKALKTLFICIHSDEKLIYKLLV